MNKRRLFRANGKTSGHKHAEWGGPSADFAQMENRGGHGAPTPFSAQTSRNVAIQIYHVGKHEQRAGDRK